MMAPFWQWKSVVLLCLVVSPLLADEAKNPEKLDGLRFQSVDKFVIGELPSGPVSGFRTLNFQDGMFTYAPSDGIEIGKYLWDAKTGIVDATNLGGGKYKGEYDAKTKVMTWAGTKYKLLEAKK